MRLPLGQLRCRRTQLQVEFFQPARHFDRPAVVAEVPAHFTHDRGHCERHEVRTGLDVVANDGIDQAHAGHLHQIIAGFPAAVESPGDVVGQWKAPLHDAVSVALVFW